tara:strand:- start:322 stop:555 length:234 start_codon:yes stop_codon:yes gene_type:complete
LIGIKMDEEKFLKAHLEIQKIVMDMMEDKLPPLAIAGILQANATKMYRAILNDDEFQSMMTSVIETSKEDINKKVFH